MDATARSETQLPERGKGNSKGGKEEGGATSGYP